MDWYDVKLKLAVVTFFAVLVVVITDVALIGPSKAGNVSVTSVTTSLYASKLRFHFADGAITAISGQFHVLQCPNTNTSEFVSWLFNGTDIDSLPPDARRYTEGAMLVFLPVEPEDTGLYECYANDKLHGMAEFTVHSKKRILMMALMGYFTFVLVLAAIHTCFCGIICYPRTMYVPSEYPSDESLDSIDNFFEDQSDLDESGENSSRESTSS